MDGLLSIFLLVIFLGIGLLIGWLMFRKKDKASQVHIHSSIEELKAIGKLNVFKAITKEIITETDHSFGEFGSKYLSWVLSHKKMAMIFEFDVTFSYDLQHPDFAIVTEDQKKLQFAKIVMPPCEYEVAIRNLQFYDERKAVFLPWLLPNLIGEAFGGRFSEADKNRLIESAKDRATSQAQQLIKDSQKEVEQSAKNTLSALARSFNVDQLEMVFKREDGVATLPVAVELSDDALDANSQNAA